MTSVVHSVKMSWEGAQCPLTPRGIREDCRLNFAPKLSGSVCNKPRVKRGRYDWFFRSAWLSPTAIRFAMRHLLPRFRNCTANRGTLLLAPAFPLRAGGSGSPLLSEWRRARPVKANGTKATSPVVVNKKPADLDGDSAGFKENRAEQCSLELRQYVAKKSGAFNSFLAENAPVREVGKKPIP